MRGSGLSGDLSLTSALTATSIENKRLIYTHGVMTVFTEDFDFFLFLLTRLWSAEERFLKTACVIAATSLLKFLGVLISYGFLQHALVPLV